MMLRNRYRRITSFFAKVIFSLIFWEIFLPGIGLNRLAGQKREDRLRAVAIQFRTLAIDMGGLMIKVGQFLSTRVDVLPEEITGELANLQDEVQPETFDDIRKIAEKELNGRLEDYYSWLDPNAMAAASLGQVHKAQLNTAEGGIYDVVVKVQRPNIETIIATDLAALRTVGKWIQRYRPIARRADVDSLLDEFSRITYEEINYLKEGKNAETFAGNFEDREGVEVPKVIWSLTTRRVLTLENVQAIKITDYDEITRSGINRAEVAQRLFETYLKQIFEDGFFHADPHPGNLFVEPLERGSDDPGGNIAWQLNFVDFGMVGRVPPNVRAGLREMAMGVGTRDSARVVKSYQMLGILLPEANLDLIEQIESKAFEEFWGRSMNELKQISWDEIHDFAKEFREVVFEIPFQIPEDLIFLGRCVAILAGMCMGLNPDFNVWEGLEPFARKIMQEEIGQGWRYWLEEFTYWGKALVQYPRRLDNLLVKIERGELSVNTPSLNQQAGRLEKTGRRLIYSVIFAVFFISGIQLFLANETGFGIGLLLVSLLPLWKVVFIRR
jgi:predicted unusual protein kinase regulating ubiquinone biosynthesis (AarF/ABC1/UbiB family)